jgi:hypothetical protein
MIKNKGRGKEKQFGTLCILEEYQFIYNLICLNFAAG